MSITSLHYRLMYALVLLGIVAYSIAEEDLVVAAIAAPIALAAWVLVGPSSPTAPRWLINGALVAVTGHMLFSWAGDIGDTIGVLCRYVTWLQLIKLFEPRAARDQAQIIMLSIMLVIGSCLTSVTINLGAVLVLYAPTLLLSVMLFQLHSTLARAGAGPSDIAPRAAVRHFGALGLSTAAMLVMLAGAIFVIVPRGAGEGLLGGSWKPPESDPVTGFRDHVQLGAEGTLTDSRRIVMEMTVDPPESDPGARGRVHLLRGAVLDTYDPKRALWLRNPGADDLRYDFIGRNREPDREPFRDGFVLRPGGAEEPRAALDPDCGPYTVFHISLLEDRSERLFTEWRPVAIDLKLRDQRVGRLKRGTTDGELAVRSAAARFEYTIVASPNAPDPSRPVPGMRPSPRGAVSPPIGEASSASPGASPGPLLGPVERAGGRPAPRTNPFEKGRIRELAGRILAEARIDLAEGERDTVTRAASAIELFLQKHYAYTTQMIAPAEGQDPIEMFLFDGERGGRGHCEYFAAAMAALCRAVGIQARLVAGYVASEFDPETGVYTIRDNHAHAWAEVEVRPGHWVTFDPSPAAELARLHQSPGGWSAAYRRLMSALQIAWAERFIGYDRSRQSSALQTLGASPASILASVNEWVQEQINGRNSQQVSRRAAAAEAAQAFAFVLFMATVSTLALLTTIALFRRLTRRRGLFRRAPGSEAPSDPASRALARLHTAMLAALARAGRSKPASVPSLDHARILAGVDRDLGAAVEALTRRYYASRYGRRPPTDAELAESIGLLRTVRERAVTLRVSRGTVPSRA